MDKHGDFEIAAGTPQTSDLDKRTWVRLPKGINAIDPPDKKENGWVYHFPGKCETRTEPVNRWLLALVISLAVLGICLWGTVIGCLIPLAMRQLGIDPAIASGALVATFVDVTGIAIFFSVAWVLLL